MSRTTLLSALLFFFIIIASFSVSKISYAQGAAIPGVSCGVPEGQGGTNKCCYNATGSLPHIPIHGVLEHIWVIGDLVKQYEAVSTNVEIMNKKYVIQPCIDGYPDQDAANPACTCQPNKAAKPIPKIAELCQAYLTDRPAELKSCIECADAGKYWSGLGCVPLNFQTFISDYLLSFGIGLGGFIALLCIIYSAFMLQTSQGNPESIKKAQENMTSCILGLILIIFSVFILRLIGVNILRIPGFV